MEMYPILTSKIQQRYTPESQNACNLSCGSNLDFLEVKEGEKILDLGCGRGMETMQAAALTGQNGLAVGLDITQAMIEEALRISERAGVGNTRFYKGDIECLPLRCKKHRQSFLLGKVYWRKDAVIKYLVTSMRPHI